MTPMNSNRCFRHPDRSWNDLRHVSDGMNGWWMMIFAWISFSGNHFLSQRLGIGHDPGSWDYRSLSSDIRNNKLWKFLQQPWHTKKNQGERDNWFRRKEKWTKWVCKKKKGYQRTTATLQVRHWEVDITRDSLALCCLDAKREAKPYGVYLKRGKIRGHDHSSTTHWGRIVKTETKLPEILFAQKVEFKK